MAPLLLLFLMACLMSTARAGCPGRCVPTCPGYPRCPSPIPPSASYYRQVQESNVVAIHLLAIPGTTRYLEMERYEPSHPDDSPQVVGTYDVATGRWVHIETPDSPFCSGATMMPNGSVAIIGGSATGLNLTYGKKSIRTFTDGSLALSRAGTLQHPRWYPSITLLPNGKILAYGGTDGEPGPPINKLYEIWDPNGTSTITFPILPAFLNEAGNNYYPFNYVLPTGHVFSYSSRAGWILEPNTGEYLVRVPKRPASIVSYDALYSTEYPTTGSSVMLPLLPENDYAVEVMLFGGQDLNNSSGTACSESLRLAIGWNTTGGGGTARNTTYSFGDGWMTEVMGFPRVMGDATLLPNGVVILLNGGKTGVAGATAYSPYTPTGQGEANYPVLYAEQYDPYAAPGSRWTTLNYTDIARLYHSTAALTPDGTILVSGCEYCNDLASSGLPLSPPPTNAEYRQEIFTPHYFLDFAGKPLILSVTPAVVQYKQLFQVQYTGVQDPGVTVTSAVLVAPSATTHSFNANQRVVGLVITDSNGATHTLTLRAPPSARHAPPQRYMLFLLNGYTYSTAQWVTLTH